MCSKRKKNAITAISTAGGIASPSIARWNGTAWSALGAGLGGVVCGCAGKSGPWASSELFTRAPTKALEDLPTKRVHADDAEVLDIPHRLEVDTTARHLWRDQHLGAAYEELMELQNAAQAVESATSALSTAAQRARQAGATWEQIGNATGTTRQSAHERWS